LPASQTHVGTLHHIRIRQRAFGFTYSRFISAVSPLDRRRALRPIQSSSFAARNRQPTGGAYFCSNRSISAEKSLEPLRRFLETTKSQLDMNYRKVGELLKRRYFIQ
jgi:hypothetical protein